MKTITKTKKVLISILATLSLACVGASVGLSVNAKAESPVSIAMKDGGSVRTADPMGFGFMTELGYTEYNALVETYGDRVITGTLIARERDAKAKSITLDDTTFTAESLTENAIKFADVKNSGFINADTAETDGVYQFRGSVVGIDEANTEIVYCGRGYVGVLQEGSQTVVENYYYSPYTYSQARSMQYVAEQALEDTKATADDEYKHETADGVYSPYDDTQRTFLNGYMPTREYSKTLFNPTADSDYLDITDKQQKNTKSVITDATTLGFAGDYKGAALEIKEPDNNGKMYVKVPQIYQDDFDKEEIVKIGMWFAVGHTGENSKTTPIYVGGGATDCAFKEVSFNKEGSSYALDTFYYFEADYARVKDNWNEGVLNLLNIWAEQEGANMFTNNYAFYIGEITFKTQADIDAEAEAIEGAKQVALLTNGINSENYQYILNGTTKGAHIPAENNTLAGGYTGDAVQFSFGSGNTFYLQYPTSQKPTDTENKYFSMWLALKTEVEGSTLDGYLNFNQNTGKGAFTQNYTYVSGGASTVQVDFKTESRNYKTDTWYKIIVPLSTATTEFVDGTGFKLFTLWSTATNSNFRLLIGNIEILTDESMTENYLFKASEVSQANSISSYVGTAWNGLRRTYVSKEEVAALGFENPNNYQGAAVKVEQNGTFYVKLTQSVLDSYLNEENGYSHVRIWYAVSTSDNSAVVFGKNSKTLTNTTGSDKTITRGSWLYIDITIADLKTFTTDSTIGTPLDSTYGLSLLKLWSNGAVHSFYIGDIEMIKA